jgi:peptide/nickel transport system substrate-binding protein
VKFNFQRTKGSQILHDRVCEVEIVSPCPFVSYTPGVELVMAAFEDYWRESPARQASGVQKRARSRDAASHAEAGEADVAYLLDVPLAEEVKRDPTLKVACSGGIGTFFYPWSAPLEDV